VPAFPVYSMDDDQVTALVAAGTVYPEPDPEQDRTNYSIDMDAIRGEVRKELEAEEAQEDRAWRLRELLEWEEEMAQDQRAELLRQIYAAEAGDAPVPVLDAGDEALFSDEAIMTRQADAQFTVTEEPEGAGSPEASLGEPSSGGQEPAPVAGPPVNGAQPTPSQPAAG
jgi:hypothetical protein